MYEDDNWAYIAIVFFILLGSMFLVLSVLMLIKQWKYSNEIVSIWARIQMKIAQPLPDQRNKDDLNNT